MMLRTFLDDTYEPWMKATYGRRTTQVALIRSAFRELLDLNLSEFTTARIERWRVNRTFHHAASDAPAKRRSRGVKRSTINRNIKALRAALHRATEALADAAEERTRVLPGFAEEPDGFTIERYEIDKDHWPRGFVRL